MKDFIKKESVFVISTLCALVSMLFVFPDSKYIEYIDFRVIGLLFVLMSIVSGFRTLGVFESISTCIINKVKKCRHLVMMLWMLCFFMSMFITNDVALITFVPLAIMVLRLSNNEKYIIYTVVLQTIAANLGSMFTPMGNPQNLYLYSYYGINTVEFFTITIPVLVISFLLLVAATFFVKNNSIEINTIHNKSEKNIKLYLYIVLGIFAIMAVFKIIDWRYVVILTALCEIFADRKIILKVDWFLLLTFIAFFVFVGNIGRIETIKDAITFVIGGRELITAVVSSQIISNVPAAVMLSGFTDNYRELILGTNIGGLGTLVASLASLISFKIYSANKGSNIKKYLLVFTVMNLIFIIILLTVIRFCYNI